jgi:hypothetical protein
MNKRLQNTIGLLSGLQGLTAQQDQSDYLRSRIASEDTQRGQSSEMHPLQLEMLKSQIAIQPLQQQRMQSELDYLPQEREMQQKRMQLAEMAGVGQLMEPLAYGANPAMIQILKSRGLLPETFGQEQLSPEDQALKAQLMQYIQQKGQQ